MSHDGSQPLVSIITPSYNQSAFIGETILSVVNQDYPWVEHIIVDGGSTDGSVEIIRSYAQQNPGRIRWISEPDEGQTDAINKGFSMARGQILAWLNSDDGYLFRSTLDEVVQAFAQFAEADVIYGDAILIDKDNRLLKVLSAPPFDYNWLLRGCRLVQPATFFRHHVTSANQLDVSVSLALDYEFWLRLGRKYTFVHVPGLWAVDRNHPARKIIAHRNQLNREKRSLRQRYGQNMGAGFYLQRFSDKLKYGLQTRLKGLLALPRLYSADVQTLAVPLRLEPLLITIWRQLWKRNQSLL